MSYDRINPLKIIKYDLTNQKNFRSFKPRLFIKTNVDVRSKANKQLIHLLKNYLLLMIKLFQKSKLSI